jgi:inner membrane protein
MRAQRRERTVRSDGPMWLSWRTLGFAVAGLVVFDIGTELAGGSTIPGGPLDEVAHLLTTLLLLWALGRVPRPTMLAALVASVAIDLDHVPGRLGSDWLTAGTPRPFTHSLVTIAVVLGAAAIWRRRRALLAGVALGLAAHFFRDVTAEGGGVALLWPWSDRGFTVSHWSFAAVMVVVVSIDAWRCRQRSHRRELPERAITPRVVETAETRPFVH